MNSLRCSNCSFLNFASATVCKRCQSPLDTPAEMGGDGFADAQAGEHSNAYYPQPAYQPDYFQSPVAPLPQRSKVSGMNGMLLALFCGAVAVAAVIGFSWKSGRSAAAGVNWTQHSADDGSYTVMMPGKPVESVQEMPTAAGKLQMHISMADLNVNGAYVAAYVDYPAIAMKAVPQEVLDASAQGAVRNSRGTLLSKKNITLDGHPGVELEIQPPAGEVPGGKGGRAVARIYWAAPRLYMTFGGGPETSDLQATLTKFHDSFRLLK
jgi:hypothetical protein